MDNRFEKFTSYMLQLNRYIQKIKEIEMSQFNLHSTHCMCLYFLDKHPEGLTSGQLTNLCKEDKAAISRAIKQLIELNYVHLDKDINKKNYRGILTLTTEGQKISNIINDRINEMISIISDGLDDTARNNLYNSLEIILNNFEKFLS